MIDKIDKTNGKMNINVEKSDLVSVEQMSYERKDRTADEIEVLVREIYRYAMGNEATKMRRENMDNYKQFMMRKFGEFHYNYPTLFFALIENPSGFPMNRLRDMLAMKRKVETQVITQEEADVKMGQDYFDEFAGGKGFK